MADVATPSGAALLDAGSAGHKRPEVPDQAVYEAALKQAEKEHAEATAKYQAIRTKLDVAKPSKESPSSKKRSELIAQLKEIREKQSSGKSGRTKVFDAIKKEEADVKELINAQKLARGKSNFKSAEDVDREINRLDAQVNRGDMKIVDEKKALAEISSLRKQRKTFSGLDAQTKQIDAKKAKIKELRDTLDDPVQKALSEQYSKIQAEVDAIKAEQDEAFKSINDLRDERKKLQELQQEKWLAMKKVKDDHFHQKRTVREWDAAYKQKQWERGQAEREAKKKEERMTRAKEVLADAGVKAYIDEIRSAETLLRFLDPTYVGDEKAPLQAPSAFQATAQRTIEDSGIKGMRVVKKEEEDYFAGSAKGKKGKKNKKHAGPESPAAGKYSCPPAIMADCTAMGIDPPMSQADAEIVRKQVEEKLAFWKKDQAAQTEKNIAKAKKDLERLEAEEDAVAEKPAASHAHGETKATAGVAEGGSIKNEIELVKAAAADVIADLKGASLEDAKA